MPTGSCLLVGEALLQADVFGQLCGVLSGGFEFSEERLELGGHVFHRACCDKRIAPLEADGDKLIERVEDVFGGGFGPGVIDLDPLFTAPATGNLHLTASSPCIDAADGDLASTADFDGNPRTYIATVANSGAGTPAYVDMGAYERQP